MLNKSKLNINKRKRTVYADGPFFEQGMISTTRDPVRS
jgi:hypothetical protein